MKITEREVRYVADLANLKLTDEEVARLGADLDEILVHAGVLRRFCAVHKPYAYEAIGVTGLLTGGSTRAAGATATYPWVGWGGAWGMAR